MRFSIFAAYLERLENTSSRNEITRVLAELFAKAGVGEIGRICYLLSGELVPAYRGIDFNIAEKTMTAVIARAYGRTSEEAVRRYKVLGDHGNLANEYAMKQSHAASGLSVAEVYERFFAVAGENGEGSQDRRAEKLARLFGELDPLSAKFAARIPVGKLRLGLSDATILDALSFMVAGDKSARSRIEAAYNVTADIGALASRLKAHGLSSLLRLEATPGIPIRPSLAERLDSVEDIIVKVGPEVAVEPKLDGFRTQIHVWQKHGKKEVALFSRNLENTAAMFPEIADAAGRLGVRSAILDAEAIGFNADTGRYASFQETAKRKRKHDIKAFVEKIPLVALVFDVLYLNGKPLLKMPYAKRREILRRVMSRGVPKELRIDSQRVTSDPAVISSELKASISNGLEGLVVKSLSAAYQAGSRGFHWIKLKATTAALGRLRSGEPGRAQLPDTIDCVVMGVYKGKGKRAAFGIGGFLLGVKGRYGYESISRLGSGLSDEQLRRMRSETSKLKVSGQPKEYAVRKEMIPDIWVKPSLVLEILADEISLSPHHSAGAGVKDRGYSLRFPRLVRMRDDKSPADATTVAEIRAMHSRQPGPSKRI